MKIIHTGIKGLVVLEPEVFGDTRGYFLETWNQAKFVELGIDTPFVQDNESKSCYGVIRGLHYHDVAVDIRKGSPTFGKHYGVELSCDNKLMMLIPVGFAHGFSVISECAVFSYKCSTLYNKESEKGINVFDKSLDIDWKIPREKAVISQKDIDQPAFENAVFNFTYR